MGAILRQEESFTDKLFYTAESLDMISFTYMASGFYVWALFRFCMDESLDLTSYLGVKAALWDQLKIVSAFLLYLISISIDKKSPITQK